jgi:flagellar protein FliL
MTDKAIKHSVSSGRTITLAHFLIVLLLLLEIGGIAAWKLLMTDVGSSPVENRANMASGSTFTYPLDTYTLNLAQRSGTSNRSLKLGVVLGITTRVQETRMDEWKPLLNDSALMLLSGKTYEDLATVEGKRLLKQELLIRMKQILGEGVVQDIYFSEFG